MCVDFGMGRSPKTVWNYNIDNSGGWTVLYYTQLCKVPVSQIHNPSKSYLQKPRHKCILMQQYSNGWRVCWTLVASSVVRLATVSRTDYSPGVWKRNSPPCPVPHGDCVTAFVLASALPAGCYLGPAALFVTPLTLHRFTAPFPFSRPTTLLSFCPSAFEISCLLTPRRSKEKHWTEWILYSTHTHADKNVWRKRKTSLSLYDVNTLDEKPKSLLAQKY